MNIKPSNRFNREREGIWKKLNIWIQEAKLKGRDIINLGIGSPDQRPSQLLIDKLSELIKDQSLYGYPFSENELHIEISNWYKKRFNITIDPDTEIIHTIGAQEGLTNLPVALLNSEDILLYPDPGYPLYKYLANFAYSSGYAYPLYESNGFIPHLEKIPQDILRKSRLIIVNYPSNPLAATIEKNELKEIVEFAKKENIIILYDNTYCEIAFDGYIPPSIFEIEGAKEIAVELHSFSKTYNLPGIRLGFFAGNREIIKILSDVKSNIDFGVFKPFQKLGAFALKSREVQEHIRYTVETYKRRRNLVIEKLSQSGWKVNKPKATFYIFAKLPEFIKDEEVFVHNLIINTGVVVLPGTAFGENGKGYIRIALVREEDIILEAIERITKFVSNCV